MQVLNDNEGTDTIVRTVSVNNYTDTGSGGSGGCGGSGSGGGTTTVEPMTAVGRTIQIPTVAVVAVIPPIAEEML